MSTSKRGKKSKRRKRAYVVAEGSAERVLTSLTLASPDVTGGLSLTATVTLDGPAPPPGIIIRLSSSAPSVAKVKAKVRIHAHLDSATFEIKTTPVAANVNVVPPGVRVEIAARGPGGANRSVIRRATLRVVPPFVKALGFFSPIYGGDSAFGLVILTGPAPAGGARVWLTSANPMLAIVPESIMVPPGASGAFVTATTNGVPQTTPVDISAQRGVFVVKTATLQLLPAALERIEITPPSVAGGTTASGGVFLLGEAAGSPIQVMLSSDSMVATPQPSALDIPAGANNAPFTVVTQAVDAPTTVTISCQYGGVSKVAALQVLPAQLESLTLSPGKVFGGALSHGEVMLNGPAPSAGAVVTLERSHNCPAQQAPTLPPSVTAYGNAAGEFDIQTFAVANECQVRIRAEYLGACLEATLTVAPANPGSQPPAYGSPCAAASVDLGSGPAARRGTSR